MRMDIELTPDKKDTIVANVASIKTRGDAAAYLAEVEARLSAASSAASTSPARQRGAKPPAVRGLHDGSRRPTVDSRLVPMPPHASDADFALAFAPPAPRFSQNGRFRAATPADVLFLELMDRKPRPLSPQATRRLVHGRRGKGLDAPAARCAPDSRSRLRPRSAEGGLAW